VKDASIQSRSVQFVYLALAVILCASYFCVMALNEMVYGRDIGGE